MKKELQKDERPYLIIGCGHKFSLCSRCDFSHPKTLFVTADRNRDRNPDINKDVYQEEFKQELNKNYHKFSAIVFEHFPLYPFLDLSDQLQKDGCLIYLGNHLVKAVDIFGSRKTIWAMNNEKNGLSAIIVTNSKTLELKSEICSYLKPYLYDLDPKEAFVKIELTPEIMSRIKIVDKLIFGNLTQFFVAALHMKKEPSKPLTAGMLKAMMKNFPKPSFSFFRFFQGSVDNDNLNNFLKQLDNEHVLNEKQLSEVLTLINSEFAKLWRYDLTINTESNGYNILKSMVLGVINQLIPDNSLENKEQQHNKHKLDFSETDSIKRIKIAS